MASSPGPSEMTVRAAKQCPIREAQIGTEVRKLLYYANGGPGPATRLLRVDAPGDGDYDKW